MQFKLKKMPGGMSYDEIRARQRLNEENASDEYDAEESADDSSSKLDSTEFSEAPVSVIDKPRSESLSGAEMRILRIRPV